MRLQLLTLILGLSYGCSPTAPAPITASTANPTSAETASTPVAESSSAAVAPPPASATAAPAQASANLADHLGRCVRVTGRPVNAKVGPQLLTDFGDLWIMPRAVKDWDDLPPGVRVEVRGIVRERKDLPVFVRKPGEPIPQGMEVPAGTDLDAARRRLVIEDATFELISSSWAPRDRPIEGC